MPIMQTLLQTPNVSPFIPMQVVDGRLVKGGNTPVDLRGVSYVSDFAFYWAFYKGKQKVGFINSDNLQLVNEPRCFQNCFLNDVELVDPGLNNVKNVTNASNAFESYCENCTSLLRTGLDNLESVYGSNYCFAAAFYGCTALTDPGLHSLVEIKFGSNTFAGAFRGCTNIKTAKFEKLKYLSSSSDFYNIFHSTGLENLYFPSFRAEENEADTMEDVLGGVTGCTVHFYKNDMATMSSWQSIINGLGGTNTTVLFDLGVNATVSIPSGYSVFANGNDITSETTFDFREGENDIIYITPNNEIGYYVFVADSTTTEFVLDTTGISYNTFQCTSNLPNATYFVYAKKGTTTVAITNIPNNTFYCATGFDLHVLAETSSPGYYTEPIDTTSAASSTLNFEFVPYTEETIDTSNFLTSITGDTDYASVDTTNNQLLYHYPTNAAWSGSVQIALNVPAGTTAIVITTRAYVSSEANYDFGYLALGTARANPQPTNNNVKNGTIANGVYLFRQSGQDNVMTDVSYKETNATYNVLTVGYAQDRDLKGTNTLYVEPITIKYLQGA